MLQLGGTVRNIVNMAYVAVLDAQQKCTSDTNKAIEKSTWWKRMKTRKK